MLTAHSLFELSRLQADSAAKQKIPFVNALV